MSDEWIDIIPDRGNPDTHYQPAVEDWQEDAIKRYRYEPGTPGWRDYGSSKALGPGMSGAHRRIGRSHQGQPEIGSEIWVANHADSFTVANAAIDPLAGTVGPIPGTEVKVPKTKPSTEVRRGGLRIVPRIR